LRLEQGSGTEDWDDEVFEQKGTRSARLFLRKLSAAMRRPPRAEFLSTTALLSF